MSSPLSKLVLAIDRLRGVPADIASDAVNDIQDLIEKEFADKCDPYGNPWSPLAASTRARGRRIMVLQDTGAMANSVRVRATGGDIVAEVDEDYAVYHQYGALVANLPKRTILPDNGIPDAWDKALIMASDSAFKRTFEGK